MNAVSNFFRSYTKEQAMSDLARAENKSDDAVSDFKVITDTLRPSEDLQDATSSFISLLNLVGSDNTSKAQEDYRKIGQLLRPEELRSSAVGLFVQIYRAENQHEDVFSNFYEIDQAVKPGESRAQRTQEFLNLLAVEGNSNTGAVTQHFRTIDASARKWGESHQSTVDDFVQHYRSENKVEDAAANFSLVDQSRKPGETRAQVSASFLQLLRMEGNDNTTAVQNHFQVIDRSAQSSGDSRQAATNDFQLHYRAENKVDDAVANFELATSLRRPGETRESVTDNFLSLLHLEGSDNTGAVQSHFRMVNNAIRTDLGETRSSVQQDFATHYRAENKVQDAEANFQLVNNAIRPYETRSAVTGEFQRLLRAFGSDNTQKAQNAFGVVNGYVSEQASRTSLTDSFLGFYRQSGSVDTAIQMFQAVH